MNNFCLKLGLVLTLCLSTQWGLMVAQASTLYRWVDETGRVHYSYTMPAEARSLGHQEIGRSGIVLKKVAPVKTQAELDAERRQIEFERLQQVKAEQERFNDTMLMSMYSSVEELDKLYEGRLFALNESLQKLYEQFDLAFQELVLVSERYADHEASDSQATEQTKTATERQTDLEYKLRLANVVVDKKQELALYQRAIKQNSAEESALIEQLSYRRTRLQELLKKH